MTKACLDCVDALFRFCASIKLAVVVILLLAAILAIGTFYESRYGAPAALAQVYGSGVFLGVLALLAVNVMAAAVIRFPWKRHQTGFVVTHLGILTLLAGALVSYRSSVDGRLTLVPGQTDTDFALSDERIQVRLGTTGQIAQQGVAAAGEAGGAWTLPAVNWSAAGYPSFWRALWPRWPELRDPSPRSPVALSPGMSLQVLGWLPAARANGDGTYTRARISPSKMADADRAALVALTVDGHTSQVWLPRGGDARLVPTPRGPVFLAYGFTAAQLPEPIRLVSATRLKNPGTNDPAAYEAVLATSDSRQHTLTLNHPLSLASYTVYLSSLDDSDPARPKATLALRRDPGTPVKYTGAGLMCFGIFLMFYMKAYFKAPRAAGSQSAPSEAQAPVPQSVRAQSPVRIASIVLAAALLVLVAQSPALAQPAVTTSSLRLMDPYTPVLDAGRVKPLDTAARETVRLLTGREKLEGQSAIEIVRRIEHDPLGWATRPLLHVPLIELRQLLSLPPASQYVAPSVLRASEAFRTLATTALSKRSHAEQLREEPDLSRLEIAAIALADRLALFDSLASGRHFHYVQEGVDTAALEREVTYNRLHPFRISWIIHFLALLTLSLSLLTSRRWPYRLGVGLLVLAIGWSALAFAWRCSITGWAPVTNVYETVIWVALVGAIVAVGIELRSRDKLPAIAGALAATLAGIVADTMPPEYGSSVRTLTPVLRSNLWLTIHVLTIVSSYAAFLVATVLANIALWQMAFGGKSDEEEQSDEATERRSDEGKGEPSTSPDQWLEEAQHTSLPPSSPSVAPSLRRSVASLPPSVASPPTLSHLYRTLQLGTLLVATGTILGGLWADVSWGRFWGWDPKETWALITLLTYLALLHARYTRWLTPFSFAAGSILAFLTVLMSWYGVNFLLGTGLHSYGFNTGGEPYAVAVVGAQLAFLALCTYRYRTRQSVAPSSLTNPAGRTDKEGLPPPDLRPN